MTESNFIQTRTVGREWMEKELRDIDDMVLKVINHLVANNRDEGYRQAITTARSLHAFLVERHDLLLVALFDL